MFNDLTVVLENRPGTLAALGKAIGEAGINIEGLCGFASDGEGIVHILVEDAATARRAIEAAGLEVRDEREVIVVDVRDEPGTMGETIWRIANRGVNVELVYGAFFGNRLVIGANDLSQASAAL